MFCHGLPRQQTIASHQNKMAVLKMTSAKLQSDPFWKEIGYYMTKKKKKVCRLQYNWTKLYKSLLRNMSQICQDQEMHLSSPAGQERQAPNREELQAQMGLHGWNVIRFTWSTSLKEMVTLFIARRKAHFSNLTHPSKTYFNPLSPFYLTILSKKLL